MAGEGIEMDTGTGVMAVDVDGAVEMIELLVCPDDSVVEFAPVVAVVVVVDVAAEDETVLTSG